MPQGATTMTKHKDLSPNFKRALLEKVKPKQRFWELLGIEIVDVKEGWAKLRLPFSKKLIHPLGVAHGGAIFSLADSAVAMALLGLAGKDEEFTTVEMKINYVRSFKEGEMIAEASIFNKGNRIALGDVEIHDERGRLIAKSLATYLITKNKTS
jgi:acyl-CoA thioesterase